jgi:hypothetical protein
VPSEFTMRSMSDVVIAAYTAKTPTETLDVVCALSVQCKQLQLEVVKLERQLEELHSALARQGSSVRLPSPTGDA